MSNVHGVSEELIELCRSETINTIKNFIKKNKNQIDINFADYFMGYTALHLVCSDEKYHIAKLLVKNFKDQIDINLKDTLFGNTPYMLVWVARLIWLNY